MRRRCMCFCIVSGRGLGGLCGDSKDVKWEDVCMVRVWMWVLSLAICEEVQCEVYVVIDFFLPMRRNHAQVQARYTGAKR